MTTTPGLEAMQSLVESAWEERTHLSPVNAPVELRGAIEDVLGLLEQGVLRQHGAAARTASAWSAGWLPRWPVVTTSSAPT